MIKVINLQNQDAIYKVDFIIFATEGPHYGIRMEFDCKSDSCALIQEQVLYVLQGYGASKVHSLILPKVLIKQKYVSIVYDLKNQGLRSFTQAIYELPEKESKNQAVFFYAAIKDPSYGYYETFQTEMYNKREKTDYTHMQMRQKFRRQYQLYLISNLKQYGQLRLYKVNQSPKLLIDGNISQTQVSVTLKNDYIERGLSFDLTISGNDSDQSDYKGHTVLWIILGILGGLIVLGIGYKCYTKNKSKNEPLL